MNNENASDVNTDKTEANAAIVGKNVHRHVNNENKIMEVIWTQKSVSLLELRASELSLFSVRGHSNSMYARICQCLDPLPLVRFLYRKNFELSMDYLF